MGQKIKEILQRGEGSWRAGLREAIRRKRNDGEKCGEDEEAFGNHRKAQAQM
jgi:hypothetical protein